MVRRLSLIDGGNMTVPNVENSQRVILIVDDMPENLTALAGLLKPTYRVRATASGARALQIAATKPRPDLILLDVMMPEMDGYTVLARLREEPRTRDIPVVFPHGYGYHRERTARLRSRRGGLHHQTSATSQRLSSRARPSRTQPHRNPLAENQVRMASFQSLSQFRTPELQTILDQFGSKYQITFFY